MRLLALLPLLLCAAAPAPPAAAADPIVVKLATLAPEGTTWYNGLRQLGDRWTELSGGAVQVKIYAGGVAGNEESMVRKLRIGQLHGAALTNAGMMLLDEAPQVTNTPMLIESYGELDHVMEHLAPTLDQRLRDRGFVSLTWGDVGWVYLFSREPIETPDDAPSVKLYVWEGDQGALEAFRRAGFKPVLIGSAEMIPSIQTGLIDAFPHTPLAALSMQWFGVAPNMLDVPWAPLMGSTVITGEMWERIPAEHHEAFLEAAREIGGSLQAEIRRQDTKAIQVMQKYGLNVVEVDAATHERWREVARSVYPTMRGEVVPAEIFDEAQRLVDEYRAEHGSGG